MVEVGRSLWAVQYTPQDGNIHSGCTHSMTPVLVASNDAGGVVLVVQMPGTVCVNEHASGIVHKVLRAIVNHIDQIFAVRGGESRTCGGL